MKKSVVVLALLFLALASASPAVEVAGVTMPPTLSIDGKNLKLNGAGLRTKVVFKVYVAGLYLETPTKDAATVISSGQTKAMRLAILRSLKGSQVSEAISEGFEKNSKAQMGALKARLDKLGAMIPNVEKGDDIVLAYVPGKGTVVQVKGADKGVVEGKDFADGLFSVWLGANPVQDDLKRELLNY